jgi:hypothetical protein
MLRSIKYLDGYAVDATDGTIGRVTDFYLDDQSWGIRYLVVDTGTWLAGRKVLISPTAVPHADWTLRELHVSMTQEQVKDSPDIDTARPASLRSCNAVMKCHVHASDGDIGHIEDLLVDDHIWALRWLIVKTSNWWLGHKVLVAPQWIQEANWLDATVSVKLNRQSIKEAPPFDPTALQVDRREMRLDEQEELARTDTTSIGAEQARADLDDDADADEEDDLTTGPRA